MTARQPREAAETVRMSAAALRQRGMMNLARKRLLLAGAGFGLLYGAVAVQLTLASLLAPSLTETQRASLVAAQNEPDRITTVDASVPVDAAADVTTMAPVVAHLRANITDRNGQVLATSLPTADLVADPKQLRHFGYDPATVAQQIVQIVPSLTQDWVARRLSADSTYLTLAYRITPQQELALNNLGVIGLDFHAGERRSYPLGVTAAQVLGSVTVDGHGIGGAEQAFDQRLNSNTTPVRLSIDVRVQNAVRDELSGAMQTFTANAAAGIVLDVRTGEVLAMVSLPDYDANDIGTAPKPALTNHAIASVYEPGSTFKLQTAAMALQNNVVHIWDQFDAVHPIVFGRFHITDYKGKGRFLYLPEVLAYSSNLGAGHIADAVGAARQQAWLSQMGMLDRIHFELPETRRKMEFPHGAAWGRLETITIGFGQGIKVTPLHVIRGVASIANGGNVLQPTILAKDDTADGSTPGLINAADVTTSDAAKPAPAMLSAHNADIMRRLMRLVVTTGYGKPAEVPGYFVGGKTGTSEIIKNGVYEKNHNDSAFVSVFPMNNPRYAVYMMLDDPHGTKETGGYSTAAAVAAPAAGRVIARIAPMLGLLPNTQNAAAIENGLSIPLEPGVNQELPRPYLVPADDASPVVTQPLLRQAALETPAAAFSTGGETLAAR